MALACLVAGGIAACSSKDDATKHSAPTGAAGDPGVIFDGAGGNTSGNSADAGKLNGCAPPTDPTGCVGELYKGELIPLDIYVMFDQSGSMLNTEQGGVTRIDAVRDAIGKFLNDPASAGLGVGIGYFGQDPIGQTTCDASHYESADVTVADLPGNAQAIIDSLAQREPTGETPSGGAIRGACTYAQNWKADHPGREVVILLVTDGEPKAPVTCGTAGGGPCCPTLADAVQATTDCMHGKAPLKTFVLGVGPFLENLGQIATAGGTNQAYLVNGGDVSAEVLKALNSIRAAAQIPCELSLPQAPTDKTLDPTRVNIEYTTSSCDSNIVYYRDAQTSCDDATGGWYFDDPAAPTKVHLCGKTCDDVSLPGVELLFSVGCARVVPR